MVDKSVQEKLNKDVQSYRLITVATLVDRLKINGSVARKALKDLENDGKIKKVVSHARLSVYSMFGSRAILDYEEYVLTARPVARAGAE